VPPEPDPVAAFASYDGTRLAYRTQGVGPLLVCLPGGPGRASAYLEDLGGLAATRTLLMLDSRGTGRSALPADERSYGAESLAADVEALRAHLGLDRFDLLGHSAGGKVAQLFAARHPDRIDHLVLVTTWLGRASEDEQRAEIMARRAGQAWYPAAREAADGLRYAPPGERARLERELRPFWYGDWTPRAQQHAASADQQMAARASARFGVATPEADLRSALGRLGAPTLVVAGELDALTPPAASRALAEAVPGAALVEIPGAGHFPWVDAPEAFRAAVEGFLARPPRPPPREFG